MTRPIADKGAAGELAPAGAHFKRRTICPGCDSANYRIVYNRPYSDPQIVRFLHSHYDPQGKPDVDVVSDGQFILARCADCEMVFQLDIPDDFLMQKVYDEWIDPIRIYETYDGVMPTQHFLRLQEQILALVMHF